MNKYHAIIGCGRIAPNHVFGCKCSGVEIISCCDLDINKAKRFAEKYSIPNYTDNYKEILENPEIQSVSICTDHRSHFKLSMEALDHNKSVITEKPICLDELDAKEMVAKANEKNRVLCVISQHRYNKMINSIVERISEGEFGKITLINGSLNCNKTPEYYKESSWRGTKEKEGGSSLINQAIHTLDLVVWIMGEPIAIHSFGATLSLKDIIETEDTLVAIMQFKTNALGTFSTTNTSVDEWDSKVEIIGTSGSVTFSTGFPARILNLLHKDKNKEKELASSFQALQESKNDVPPTMNYYGTTHKDQIKDFFDVVEGRKRSLDMDPSEAIKTLKVVKDIYKYN